MAGISPAEYAERRSRLQRELGDGVALIPGARPRTRSNDTEHVFRQDSDLWYLTGFPQPEAVAAFSAEEFVFFVQPRDPLMETWNGRRPGVEGAVEEYGADRAYSIEELPARLPELLRDRPRLFHSFGLDEELDRRVVETLGELRRQVRRGVGTPGEIFSPHDIVHRLRTHKSPAEVEVMRAAAEISREAHAAAGRLCRPGVWEYELEAALHQVFRSRGGSGPAYNSIVGSGDNATVLHYVENRSQLRDGQVVLIDAGVELEGYASDVTRTYPVGGRYRGEARAVYEAVLAAQQAAFDVIRPGATLKQIHDAAVRTLVEGMVELGALEGGVDELIESEDYRAFYMHSTGHFLGLDVHDVGQYSIGGEPRPLEPGMCFTVEPGLYFSADGEKTPERLRGIGVRIEDDVVMTEDGYETLTDAIPKRIDQVEAWLRE